VNRPTTCRNDVDGAETGDGEVHRDVGWGESCGVPNWRPAYRRREHGLGFDKERENLSSRCEGRSPSGAHHEGQSTDAGHRGRGVRSRVEGSVMELDQRGTVVLLESQLGQLARGRAWAKSEVAGYAGDRTMGAV
jgi:hypothetical protein